MLSMLGGGELGGFYDEGVSRTCQEKLGRVGQLVVT